MITDRWEFWTIVLIILGSVFTGLVSAVSAEVSKAGQSLRLGLLVWPSVILVLMAVVLIRLFQDLIAF